MYVVRAQMKSDRKKELRNKFNDNNQTQNDVNMYVKNLNVGIDDEVLEGIFSIFGKITTAKVMKNERGKNKGFGFVCFENSIAAKLAIESVHMKKHNGRQLFVTMHENKDERRKKIAALYMGNANGGYAPGEFSVGNNT